MADRAAVALPDPVFAVGPAGAFAVRPAGACFAGADSRPFDDFVADAASLAAPLPVDPLPVDFLAVDFLAVDFLAVDLAGAAGRAALAAAFSARLCSRTRTSVSGLSISATERWLPTSPKGAEASTHPGRAHPELLPKEGHEDLRLAHPETR